MITATKMDNSLDAEAILLSGVNAAYGATGGKDPSPMSCSTLLHAAAAFKAVQCPKVKPESCAESTDDVLRLVLLSFMVTGRCLYVLLKCCAKVGIKDVSAQTSLRTAAL